MRRRVARTGVIVAACAALAWSCGARPSPPPRVNILLVTIDTLRADRVGAGVAPTLDALAASGLWFTGARTAAPLTLPSHTTIHTGLLPPQHGVRENGVGALAPEHPTVARLLKEAGYRTAAVVGAFVLDRRFGLAQGFDTYDDRIPRDPDAADRLEAERPARAVAEHAIAWLTTTNPRSPSTSNPQSPSPSNPQSPIPNPFFLWIHFYDPHAPYVPPPEYAARTKTPYDGEVAYADAELAAVLAALRAAGHLDRTLVIVAGDHGEGLGDHGERTHGMLLYESTLRVPLVIAAPTSMGVRPARIDAAVSLAEIAPTILRIAGVAPPASMKGRDLLRTSAATFDMYSETEYPRVAGWSPLQALSDGRWKMIRGRAAVEVYDLQSDPAEARNVAGTEQTIAAAMGARAAGIHDASARPDAHAVPPDVQERLRALGYVASSASVQPAADAPNPAASIAAWNDFEDALAALNSEERKGGKGRGGGKDAAAVDSLRRLAAAHPDAPVFQSTYARALKDAGRSTEALEVYRRTARRWPADAAVMHDLAVAARDAAASAAPAAAASLRDEASRADQAAIVIDPTSAVAVNGLGLLAIDGGRPADAVQAFERAAALDANNSSYWTNLGNARRAAGDRAGAEQAYRRALEVDAQAADAANGIGVLLVEAHRPGEAVAWFERALAAAPDLVDARLNLGIALQQTGDAARAADAYRQVLAAPPRYARERDAAAKLLAALGSPR